MPSLEACPSLYLHVGHHPHQLYHTWGFVHKNTWLQRTRLLCLYKGSWPGSPTTPHSDGVQALSPHQWRGPAPRGSLCPAVPSPSVCKTCSLSAQGSSPSGFREGLEQPGFAKVPGLTHLAQGQQWKGKCSWQPGCGKPEAADGTRATSEQLRFRGLADDILSPPLSLGPMTLQKLCRQNQWNVCVIYIYTYIRLVRK